MLGIAGYCQDDISRKLQPSGGHWYLGTSSQRFQLGNIIHAGVAITLSVGAYLSLSYLQPERCQWHHHISHDLAAGS